MVFLNSNYAARSATAQQHNSTTHQDGDGKKLNDYTIAMDFVRIWVRMETTEGLRIQEGRFGVWFKGPDEQVWINGSTVISF